MSWEFTEDAAFLALCDAFKESGKPVITMADYYSQGAYLLAAHADHVLLNQSGAVLIEGFGVYQTYFKSALEKFNLTPHVFKVGTYKTAVEPFLRENGSPEAKDCTQAVLPTGVRPCTLAKLARITCP